MRNIGGRWVICSSGITVSSASISLRTRPRSCSFSRKMRGDLSCPPQHAYSLERDRMSNLWLEMTVARKYCGKPEKQASLFWRHLFPDLGGSASDFGYGIAVDFAG